MHQQLGLTIEEQKEGIIRFWKREYKANQKDWVPFFHKFWRTWDTWAVGVIFLKLLWKSSFNPKFIEEVWKPNQKVLSAVLKGLLRANPYERLSAESALKLLDLTETRGQVKQGEQAAPTQALYQRGGRMDEEIQEIMRESMMI